MALELLLHDEPVEVRGRAVERAARVATRDVGHDGVAFGAATSGGGDVELVAERVQEHGSPPEQWRGQADDDID